MDRQLSQQQVVRVLPACHASPQERPWGSETMLELDCFRVCGFSGALGCYDGIGGVHSILLPLLGAICGFRRLGVPLQYPNMPGSDVGPWRVGVAGSLPNKVFNTISILQSHFFPCNVRRSFVEPWRVGGTVAVGPTYPFASSA